ncbi:hypothetical protein [Limoniibacter endophyticus]|uniref:Uncharacterized protein n=1 Tax=Limoniibacter endophyticus TaxID=1565040 RepID=A0A8J3DMF9_9HYPH|nr:hypothetical protein [Limoniibacter endophyticus]GHC64732.1 hypothetical protein GCM10010136_06890 [Limoniibacter endophyticus]
MTIWTSLKDWLHMPSTDSFEAEMNALDGDRDILQPDSAQQATALPMGIYQPSSTGEPQSSSSSFV